MGLDPTQLAQITTELSQSRAGVGTTAQGMGLTDQDMALLNAGAAQIGGAALRNYGGLPDPQAAVEALSTGSAPDLSAAFNDPKYAKLLSAIPTTPQGQGYSVAQDVPQTRDPYTMDQTQWQQHWNSVKGNDQWKDFGDMPEANIDWFNAVRGKSDPKTIRKWQSFLNQEGWSPSGQQLSASGVWDQNTDSAFRSFLVARFMPDYLYSKDETLRNRTSLFLSALGVNPADLQSATGRADPDFRMQVAERWLHTHGPGVNMRDSIGEFSDKYGSDALPQALKDLQGNWLTKIGDSLGVLPMIGGVVGTFIGGPLGALAGGGIGLGVEELLKLPFAALATGHVGLDALYKSTSALQADLSEHQLNDAEKGALNEALQAAHNSSGYLGFLDAWDRIRTRAVLSVGYSFGDFFKKGEVENPFDPSSAAFRGADIHQDNMMAGMFGSGFANAHPTLAGIGNVLANIADDPLTYGGLGGTAKIDQSVLRAGGTLEEAMSRRGITGIRFGQSASRVTLLRPTAIRDAMREGTLGQHLLNTAFNPQLQSMREMAKLLKGKDIWDVADLMGEEDPAMLPVLQNILEEPDENVRVSKLVEQYGERVLSPDHAFNVAEARKRLTPQYFDRLSKGKKMTLLTSHIDDRSANVLLENPFNLGRQLRDGAQALGMTADELRPILTKAHSADINVREEAVMDYRRLEGEAMERRIKQANAGTLDDFEKWIDGKDKGRRAFEPNEARYTYNPVRDEMGRIVEGSVVERRMTFDTGDPERDRMLLERAEEARNGVAAIHEGLDNTKQLMIDNLMHGRPDTAAERQAVSQLVEQSQEYIDAQMHAGRALKPFHDALTELQNTVGRRGVEGARPMAAVSGQFQKWARTRYTPYEVLAYLNPVTRRSEALQARMRLDKLQSVWKGAVLAKFASGMRIVLGDESARIAISQFLDGGPRGLLDYLRTAVQRRRGTGNLRALPAELAQSIHSMLSGMHPEDFIPYIPTDHGYQTAFVHFLRNIWGKSVESKIWTEAMRVTEGAEHTAGAAEKAGYDRAEQALITWLKDAKAGKAVEGAAEAKEHIRRAGATTEAEIERLGKGIHQQFLHFTKHSWTDPERQKITKWLDDAAHGKKLNEHTIGQFLRTHTNNPDVLPLVAGRRVYGTYGSQAGRFNQITEAFQHKFTDSWVQHARTTAYNTKFKQWQKKVAEAHPEWDQDTIDRRAANWAGAWVRKNTYQGQRSLQMTAARTLFPFGGATVNFNRFILREFAKHPWTARPTLELTNYISARQQNGDAGFHVPMTGWLLSKLGFAGADDITYDPLHAFFLTSEGYSGFMPGLGPIFMYPLNYAASQNPDLQAQLSKIPGFEYIGSESPMVPWATDLANAASLATTGRPFLEGVPLLGRPTGYYEKQVLEEERAQHADFLTGQRSEDTSAESATRSTAIGAALTGLSALGVPANLRPREARTQALRPALQAWDAATSDADKDKVIQAFPDAAPLLKFYDRRTSRAEKQQLVSDPKTAWVQAYGTGITTSAAAGVSGYSEPTTSAYRQDIAGGRLRYLGADEYIDKLDKNDQFNKAWGLLDTLNTERLSYFMEAGINPTSTAAKQWDALYYKPVVDQIVSAYPDWGKQFVTMPTQDVAGLSETTRSLSSLATWEVIPQADGFETNRSVLWRQLLVSRDEASTALRELQARHAPRAQQQQVLDGFNAIVQQLQSLDPQFAADVSQYSVSKIEDLVKLEAATKYGSL